MGAALKREQAETRRGQQSRQNGLQDKRGAAGCAYRETVVARRDQSGFKLQRLGCQSCTGHLGTTNAFGRLKGREMLSEQAWLLASGPNPLQPERLASPVVDHRGRRSQYRK